MTGKERQQPSAGSEKTDPARRIPKSPRHWYGWLIANKFGVMQMRSDVFLMSPGLKKRAVSQGFA